MNRTMANLFLGLVVSASLGAAITVSAPNAEAKPKVTITDRIDILSKKIDKGQKANELTLKEADKLRDDITKINDRIEKAKAKNAGKLSYEDETKIEKDLNKVSVKLTAKELDKRTTSPN
ncbi:hypothetical protein BH11CYA1_BH11CYA1_38100 [soil metagenome]